MWHPIQYTVSHKTKTRENAQTWEQQLPQKAQVYRGGKHILFGTKLVKPLCHEENSISKLKQKRKSDKQIDLMGMKEDGLLFLHKVFFLGGGGGGNALHV